MLLYPEVNMIAKFNEILSAFKLKATCVNYQTHRHFAFYDLKLDPGFRINRLSAFSREIAMALGTKTTPIIKPISELGIVRFQVTTRINDRLSLKDMFKNTIRPSGLVSCLIGETDEGVPLWIDLSKNPHMLVAGTTGSGKSVLLHNLIANAIEMKNVRLYLSDTKRVEFSPYSLLGRKSIISQIAQTYSETVSMLELLVETMEMRYRILASKNLSGVEEDPTIFDKILVIIDEIGDLMAEDNSGEFQKLLIKLASKARASGIYLVVATQHPSVNVLTGVIKANFPARLACKVSSRTDSQVVMDIPGAENLAGHGDAIFKSPVQDLVRCQIAFASSKETIASLQSI